MFRRVENVGHETGGHAQGPAQELSDRVGTLQPMHDPGGSSKLSRFVERVSWTTEGLTCCESPRLIRGMRVEAGNQAVHQRGGNRKGPPSLKIS